MISHEWLVKEGKLPENILYHMAPEVRDEILKPQKPTARIHRLFEIVHQKVIDATCIRTVGHGLEDPIRRVRSARERLAKRHTGLVLLGSDHGKDIAKSLGYPIERTEYVVVHKDEFTAKKIPLPKPNPKAKWSHEY